MVVGRPTALKPGGRARVAAASPASADLAALLGLHLLGAQMEPVFGLAWPDVGTQRFLARSGRRGVAARPRRAGAVHRARCGRCAAAVHIWRARRRRPGHARSGAIRRCRISPNSTRRGSAAYRATAVQRMERRGSGNSTGVRPGAAATYAGGDGVAVAARRRRCGCLDWACRRPPRPSMCARLADRRQPPIPPPSQPMRRHCKSCDTGSPAGSTGVRPDAQEGLA